MKKCLSYLLGSAILCSSSLAFADAPVAKLDTGDTAWVLISTALVMIMTPGLAFFYAGMVKGKNAVTTLFQSISALAVVGLLWLLIGYSMAFHSGTGFVGALNWMFLNGVGQEPNVDYAATIPHQAFMIFQCMFAIITPALFTGAFAERVKFKGWILLCALWSLVVYAPVAHWVWGIDGWLRAMGALDFAGGLVVHMTAGYSALALAIMLAKRKNFGAEQKPYDLGYVTIGTSLLLFGWIGFNGGSALGANGLATQASVNTFFAAIAAMSTWILVDKFVRGTPSLMGACIGAVAGLVAITPASGFVSISSSLVIGLLAGVICNLTALTLKKKFKLDDTLDVFACHGVGGTLGVFMTALLASKSINSAGNDGVFAGNPGLLGTHIIAMLAVAVFSFVATLIIAKIVDVIFGLRSSAAEEDMGLDKVEHQESINEFVA